MDQTTYTYDNNGNALTQTDNAGTTSFTYYTNLPYTLGIGLGFVPGPKYFIKTASSQGGRRLRRIIINSTAATASFRTVLM